jgi:hypothetical protein
MKKILLNVLLFISSIIIIFIIVELIFNVFDIKNSPVHPKYINWQNAIELSEHPFFPHYSGNKSAYYLYKYKPNAYFLNQYPDNKRGYFNKQNQMIYKLNSHGYRGYDFTPKNQGHFRIISIGDSIAFGEGVKYEDTYSRIIEKRLRAKNSTTEVYNLGINGYGIRDEVASLKNNLNQYQPDLVIWDYTLNDISHGAIFEWYISMDKKKKRTLIKTPSRFINYIQNKLWKLYSSEAFVDYILEIYQSDRYWHELTLYLKRVNNLIKEKDAKLLILIFPQLDALEKKAYVFKPIHIKLAKYFKHSNIPFIDFTDIFQENDPSSLKVHYLDAHPNEIAHKLIADKVIKEIR